MSKKTYSKSQLKQCKKEALVDIAIQQQQSISEQAKQLETQARQLEELNRNMNLLLEQLKISRQSQYGRASEKLDLPGQMEMCFNEAEVTITDKYVVEPVLEQVVPEHKRRIKPKGKRDEDLSGFPVRIEEHCLPEERLKELFPDNYRRLPDEVYRKLEFHPATFEVVEHHIAVYVGAAGENQTIVRADRPAEVLKNSIVTPSLLAAILNYKYVNAMPLYRLEQEFKRNDVNLSRQVMANWVIRSSERFFSLLYDRLHQEFYKRHLLHADETPVKVLKDGRETMTNSYMWVYRTGADEKQAPAILYEYQKTRCSDHPDTFLKDFHGIVVCDGYQTYHTIAEKRPEELQIAGCWAHARRRFANVCKSLGKAKSKGTLAEAALSQIAAIYHVDNSLSELDAQKRLAKRKTDVRPLVDAFFDWVRAHKDEIPAQSETGKGFTYCLNQEKYLCTFLEDGCVPLDNNAAEIAIRSFCVGKHNWHVIDTVEGAQASAILYSIAETAKANQLKPYEYFCHLLEEIPKHMDDKNLDFLEDLLPWSSKLPDRCRKTKV